MNPDRRGVLRALAATTAGAALGGVARVARAGASGIPLRVVVIGAGFGGATAAKYLKVWNPDLSVTLVEREPRFVSCPMSNRVLAGQTTLDELTREHDTLAKRHRVRVVHDEAVAIDADKRSVALGSGRSLGYDRLIVAPGVDLDYASLPGLADPATRELVPHAWRAGPQTSLLARQIDAMPDGGVVAITIPKAPYRCPPGPYERACQIAWRLKRDKPRSKVLVLDANEKIASKEALFKAAFAERYAGMIEYVPSSELADVDATTRTAKLQFDDVRADVLNVIPPMKAGAIAQQAGLVTANGKWCEVDFTTYESKVVPRIHLLGDAILAAALMPKSGHMANQHAKVCAAAVVALLAEEAPNPAPMLNNTCYSFVSDREVVHIASVHAYDADKRTMVPVPGAGGLSPAATVVEGTYAEAWSRAIWSDMLS
jgi:sulfide dehydrogenase [flavocytochrome c] flavoprotein chain